MATPAKQNIVSVLNTFVNSIKTNHTDPGLQFVLSGDISAEQAITRLRQRNLITKGKTKAPSSLFVFSRSNLLIDEITQRRFESNTVYGAVKGTTIGRYRVPHGSIVITFSFITTGIDKMETFEQTYLAGEGLSKDRIISVELQDIGAWTYSIYWNELESYEFTGDEFFSHSAQGSAIIRGFWPVSLDQPAERIEIINTEYNIKKNNGVENIISPPITE